MKPKRYADPDIYITADHGGFAVKQQLVQWLESEGYFTHDMGAFEINPVDDYPEYALTLAETVVAENNKKPGRAVGVMLCRSAAGVTIAANKVLGVRAVAVFDEKSAIHAKEHNNAHIIAISADWTDFAQAQAIITAFITARFGEEERHIRRINQISNYEAHSR